MGKTSESCANRAEPLFYTFEGKEQKWCKLQELVYITNLGKLKGPEKFVNDGKM
jgi:hypothetical protein